MHAALCKVLNVMSIKSECTMELNDWGSKCYNQALIDIIYYYNFLRMLQPWAFRSLKMLGDLGIVPKTMNLLFQHIV